MQSERDIIIYPGEKNSIPKYCFKIVIIGEAGVGKSSIISKGTNHQLDNNKQTNYFFEFSWKNYIIDGNSCRIQIWDTCGQEFYHSLIKNFYRTSFLAYLVFSLDNKTSFEKTEHWLREIQETGNEEMIIFLIGNKCDNVNREVSNEQIEEFKNNHNITYYIETSAENNINIEQLFEDTIRKLYYDYVVMLPPDTDSCSEKSSRNINLALENKKHEGNERQQKSCQVCKC